MQKVADALYNESVATPVPRTRYRLRGRLDGHERTVDLAVGEHCVGSSRSADVVLLVTGVSRRHARLVVTGSALIVEDLGSTNGTAIDGVAIDGRSSVPSGAELRFGPVRLRVEAVEPDDGELAIALAPTPQAGESRSALSLIDGEVSTVMVGGGESGERAERWLAAIEAMSISLSDGRPVADSLAALAGHLDAAGCMVVRWHEGGDTALAGWGQLGRIPSAAEARRLVRGRDAQDMVRAAQVALEEAPGESRMPPPHSPLAVARQQGARWVSQSEEPAAPA
ncbi:MAG: FHA domain-containing protein, partial [Myxococcota bacterium]